MLLLQEECYALLIEKLLKFKPDTNKVVGDLLSALSGKRSVCCYVDRWPEGFTTAVVVQNDEETVSVHTSDVMTLKELITNANIFDWSRRYVIGGITPDVCNIFEKILVSKDVSVEKNGPNCMMAYMERGAQGDHKSPLSQPPAGYRFGRLRPSDTALVLSLWPYASHIAESVLDFMLRDLASVSVESRDGDVVGWYVEQTCGSLGMLHVLTEHRGRGLGKGLIQRLRDRLLEAGQCPYLYTDTGNEASIRLHEQCGFQKSEQTFYWLIVRPLRVE